MASAQAKTPRVNLVGCNGCGMVVFDQFVHDNWHKNQVRIASDASWGGMNRPIGASTPRQHNISDVRLE